MATTKGKFALTLLAAALAAGPVMASRPADLETDRIAKQAEAHLLRHRSDLGLDGRNAFRLAVAEADEFGQTHARFQQTFQGLRVWEGDVVTHTAAKGTILGISHDLRTGIDLNTTPSLTIQEVLAVVHGDLAPKGPYAHEPQAELVIYPEMTLRPRAGRTHLKDEELNAADVTRQVLRYRLAYHVHAEVEDPAETSHTDYILDAHTGAVIKKWNTLHTTAAVGSGNSQYSGVVSLNTNSTATGFELRDMTRGTGGTFGNNVVTDMAHSTTGNGTIYSNSSNTWGDGANYNGGSTTSANGQTAAVDAAYGIQWTWDYYKNVLGRNGIDGTGKASYLRVHYSTAYDNAFWSDTCFCMTFGDGSSFKSLESIDVAGHEMSHGVCATTANLTYSGESGGLNEANSDIHGTMVEFYAHGGGTTTVPATGGNWTIGEQLSATPLRYMYKPSKDGTSPDAWSSTIGSLDVHYSSGPSNRAFYFLSQGSSSVSSSDFYSSYLPAGMTGVGNDHAARIAFRALSVYMTASTDYAAARNAYISAAKDLYGAGSADEQAVWNAFAAINVGSAWSTTPPPPPPPTSTFVEVEANDTIATANSVARSYTAIQGNLSVSTDKDFFALTMNPGETLKIAMTGPTGPDWDLKLVDAAGTQLAISQGSTTTENITYTNSGAAAKTVYANVYVYSGTSTTPYNLALTYTGGTAPDTQAPTVSVTESGSTGTITFNATATDNVGVTKVEWYVDGALKGTSTTSPYTMTYDSTLLANGSHSLTGKAYDAAGNVGSSAAVSFSVSNTTPPPPPPSSELILNGGFESGATSWTGNTGDIGAWTGEPAHAGTKCAWMLGNGATATESLYQSITIPATATSATLTFYLHIDTAETTTTTAYDNFYIRVRNSAGTVLGTLGTFSNLNKNTGYVLKTYDLSAYKGQTVQVYFTGTEDSSLQTSFVIDDVSVQVK